MSIYEDIKNIPILDIAFKLGIHCVRRNSAMCFKGHDKKTPSLSFTPKKNLWYCFSCDKGGSNIELIKDYFEIDNKDALVWFQKNFEFLSNNSGKGQKKEIKFKHVNRYNKDLLVEKEYHPNHELYAYLLSKLELSQNGLRFLKSRGYTEETIYKLHLVDCNNPERLFDLLKYNFSVEELERCGLIRYNEMQKKYKFIWWNETIIFPFYDTEEKLCYLQGRSLNSKSDIKYINLFGLSKPIYNLNHLNKISKGAKIYLFEGITDCIMGIQSGFNSFGILGATGFKEQWTEYFTKFNINVVPDNDKAGEVFSKKIVELFLLKGKRVCVRKLPSGKDFSEFTIAQKKQ